MNKRHYEFISFVMKTTTTQKPPIVGKFAYLYLYISLSTNLFTAILLNIFSVVFRNSLIIYSWILSYYFCQSNVFPPALFFSYSKRSVHRTQYSTYKSIKKNKSISKECNVSNVSRSKFVWLLLDLLNTERQE